jgi:hypothetical protein
MHDLYLESISDMSTLRAFKKMKAQGVRHYTPIMNALIMDRDFFSTDNIEEMVAKDLSS